MHQLSLIFSQWNFKIVEWNHIFEIHTKAVRVGPAHISYKYNKFIIHNRQQFAKSKCIVFNCLLWLNYGILIGSIFLWVGLLIRVFQSNPDGLELHLITIFLFFFYLLLAYVYRFLAYENQDKWLAKLVFIFQCAPASSSKRLQKNLLNKNISSFC